MSIISAGLSNTAYLAEIHVIDWIGAERFQAVERFGDVINNPNFDQRNFDIAINHSQPPATPTERRISAC
jgi:hypothetical protein